MSQAPDDVVTPTVAAGYGAAWTTVLRWAEQGRSWSGREKNCCFVNLGDESFADVSAISGLNYADDGRGVAIVDWDHDGKLDVWCSARTAPQVRFLRNETQSDQHFLALRLEGVDCNRDAVGARVEVVLKKGLRGNEESPVKLVKTVLAGEGFLSQSSKWLHFGLGELGEGPKGKEVESVSVFWPQGEVQKLSGLSVDKHWIIKQGQSPVEWKRPSSVNIAAGVPTIPKSPGSTECTIATRRPFPSMEVITESKERQALNQAFSQSHGPRLVLLWASWCAPCAEELQELRDRYAEITPLGVDIVALSVDGLDLPGEKAAAEGLDAAIAAKQKWKLPFAIAQATVEGVQSLQQFNDSTFTAKRPLPLPTSFLIDEKGRVAAIYKGRLSLERLKSDCETLSLRGRPLLDAVVSSIAPVRTAVGRWAAPPAVDFDVLLVSQGRAMFESGRSKEAESVLKLALKYQPDSAAAHFLLGMIAAKKRDVPNAERFFQRTTKLDPKFAAAHLQLGDLYLGKGDRAAAARYYQTVVSLESNADAEGKLGVLAAMGRDLANAEKHFRRAAEIKPQDSNCQANLGRVLLDLGKHAEAVKHLSLAVDAPQPSLAAKLNLCWLLAVAPEAAVRDGNRALKLATQCVEQTKFQDPRCLDRLAAAQAEQGEFEKAVVSVTRAIKLNVAKNRLTRDLQERLELYRERQPFRLGE